jgi:hypothetical protein
MKTANDIYKEDGQVHLQFYAKNTLHYKTDCGFEFRVPTSDCGDATFLLTDRARFFNRWIRAEMKEMEKQKQELEAEREIKAVNQ